MLNLPPTGQFKESFPELRVPGPGETKLSRFQALRRDQMLHLSKAYGIPVPEGASGKELRRYMDAAYERGAFDEKNLKDKLALAKAQGLPPEQWPDEPKRETLALKS